MRHYVRCLDHTGVVLGLVFFIFSLMPSLLPRTWEVQGLLSGISVAGGYGAGVAIAWIPRHIGGWRPSATFRRRAWWAIWAVAAVTVPVILWLSSGWQRDIRRAVSMSSGGRHLYLGVFAIAGLTAAALIGIVRLIHDVTVTLARRIGRFVPEVIARLIAALAVGWLVAGMLSGVVADGLVKLARAVYSTADEGNYAGVTRPTSPFRSGSEASEVSWKSLGIEGRAFVAGGPTATEIAEFTHASAMTPIRVFAGLKSARTIHGEATKVLAELKRTGAFSRALLAVATATGTGWIDPSIDDPLEYMYGGNTAIATLQYSYLPSWMSFLVDKDLAQEAGRELFDTVYEYWNTLPPGDRPRLVVLGESLGAYGASAAFTSLADVTSRTSGALMVGTPNSTAPWRALTDHRQPGSLERVPVYGNGRTVLFAADADDLRTSTGSLTSPQVVFLQHASDPVVWWSPSLIWEKPDWLKESRGPDVISAVHWYPFITFWQVTGDLVASTSVPAGHGHQYGAEAITAWAAILHPPGWSDADTAALAKHVG